MGNRTTPILAYINNNPQPNLTVRAFMVALTVDTIVSTLTAMRTDCMALYCYSLTVKLLSKNTAVVLIDRRRQHDAMDAMR